MKEITESIKARRAWIKRLQGEIAALQRAASILDGKRDGDEVNPARSKAAQRHWQGSAAATKPVSAFEPERGDRGRLVLLRNRFDFGRSRLASDTSLDFIDLFAGLGGFHRALSSLGHQCVFASESDPELRRLYQQNFKMTEGSVQGDIRTCKDKVPPHDILCAGFPCQPFSKSGFQHGLQDKTRGTLFHEIVAVLRTHHPTYVILENVGNFELHDGGRTWRIVRETLEGLGYAVRATEHVKSGGKGLISPHHLGHPHKRERFFVVAALGSVSDDPFPKRDRQRLTSLDSIIQAKSELGSQDKNEVTLPAQWAECIDHWNHLVQAIPLDVPLPSFPIWGEESQASYPYETRTPYSHSRRELVRLLSLNGAATYSKQQILATLPSYARRPQRSFPGWKTTFIRQNRDWFKSVRRHIPGGWEERLGQFPSSLRKLEWNCQGEERDLWRYLVQFRPSGLRIRRYTACPALIAMTATQIPVLGPQRRFITRIEGLRLQGFPDSHALPKSRVAAFRALGNALHVEVGLAVARGLLEG